MRSLSLLAPLILVGCGVANTDSPGETPSQDIEAPHITSLLANGSSLTVADGKVTLNSLNINTITINFSEPVRIPSNGVAITPEIGTWETIKAGDQVTKVTYTINNKLNYNESIELIVSENIEDDAGNLLLRGGFKATISTPKAYGVAIEATGLMPDARLPVSIKYLAKTYPENTVAAKESMTLVGKPANSTDLPRVSVADLLVPKGGKVTLTMSEADNGQVCIADETFTMQSSALVIPISCTSVFPLYSNAKKWNEHLNGTASHTHPSDQAACSKTGACFHGGEYRVYPIPVNVAADCTGVSIRDALGAFDWVCDDSAAAEGVGPKAVSTGLKPGKYLSDLLNFVNPNDANDTNFSEWAKNSVIVERDAAAPHQTSPSVWWQNPVLVGAAGQLTSPHTVYTYTYKNFVTTRYTSGSQSNIIFVVKPGVEFSGTFSINASSTKPFTWIEGSFNAKGFPGSALFLKNLSYSRLQNITASNATDHGIKIELGTSNYLTLKDISTVNNTLDGLHMTTSSAKNIRLQNVMSTGNQGNGLYINGFGYSMQNIASANNAKNGITFEDASANVLSNAYLTSNGENGISIKRTNSLNPTGYNSIMNATIANNRLHGLHVIGSGSSKNSFINVISALNGDTGIAIDDSAQGHQFFNSSVSLNTSDCAVDAAATCPSNVDTYSVADLTGDFAGVIADTGSLTPFTANSVGASAQNWANAATDLATPGLGHCTTENDCSLIDWSLLSGSSFIGNTVTDTTAISVELDIDKPISIMRDAIEIIDDTVGNNNGLCEVNENCVFTPNKGAYQGHDALIDHPVADGEAPFAVTLKAHTVNGQ